MALAPITDERILGSFTEKEFGCSFDYVAPDLALLGLGDIFGRHEINAEIFVGDGTKRFAKILKTVAYVATNEDADGNAIFEKWHIREDWSIQEYDDLICGDPSELMYMLEAAERGWKEAVNRQGKALQRAYRAEQTIKDMPAKFRDEYTHYGIGMCVKPMQAQHENIGIDRCIEIVEQTIIGRKS